jgi:tetratricopeptide (TPR) repeat protein
MAAVSTTRPKAENTTMHAEESLGDLPEALPLHRVAPLWRVIAIIALIGMAGLILVALTLGLALVQRSAAVATAMTPAPMRPMPPRGGGGFGGAFPPGIAALSTPQDLPYPVKQELAQVKPAEEDQPAGVVHLSARRRFLAKGVDIWRNDGPALDHVVVSPNGQLMAYIADGLLYAGPLGKPDLISEKDLTGGAASAVMMAPGSPPMGVPVGAGSVPDRLTGRPAWSADSQIVLCVNGNVGVQRVYLGAPARSGMDADTLLSQGDWPASGGAEGQFVAFVRSLPVAKVEVPGRPASPDQSEVVLANLLTQTEKVIVPASPSSWSHLAISPDGSRLALVSDRVSAGGSQRGLRVFVLDLAGGEPKPLTLPASRVESVCWTNDGKALVYARTRDPAPADHWEEEVSGAHRAMDLYQWNLETNRETRLSRGGGFFSPSVSQDDQLFYLAQGDGPRDHRLLLRRMSLKAAREFATGEPKPLERDAAAWKNLFERVLSECRLTANVDGGALTPTILARLDETYQKLYRQQFKAEPPQSPAGLNGQRRELLALHLSPVEQSTASLVIGAVAGQLLVRKYGATWHLTEGPLSQGLVDQRPGEGSDPFVSMANPFWEQAESIVRRADGRSVVLTNEPLAATAAFLKRLDPDLTRARTLVQQSLSTLKKSPQRDQVDQALLDLLAEKRWARNSYLVLMVGSALYEEKRHAALRKLMEQCADQPPDPRKYNLLGLALLDTDLGKAIEAFKDALRYDLEFEPAYLNLAQAYHRRGLPESARLCLRRYLELMPEGEYAGDARRRLRSSEKSGP